MAQAAVIFPYSMVSPVYFAGAMQLGGLMQTAPPSTACRARCPISSPRIARSPNIRRWSRGLSGFENAIEAGRAAALDAARHRGAAARRRPTRSRSIIWRCACPNGEPLLNAEHCRFPPATRCWSPDLRAPASRPCSAPSPVSGRSAPAASLCRPTPRSCWCRSGRISRWRRWPPPSLTRPRPARSTMPISPTRSPRSGCRNSWARLNEEAHWNRMLSLGEQQRLADRARPALRAGLSVARRSDRLARRAGRSAALPAAAGAAQRHGHHLHRPSLDARRLPSPPRRGIEPIGGPPGSRGAAALGGRVIKTSEPAKRKGRWRFRHRPQFRRSFSRSYFRFEAKSIAKREFRHESRAAPVGAETARVLRGDVARRERRILRAGEDVAFATCSGWCRSSADRA